VLSLLPWRKRRDYMPLTPPTKGSFFRLFPRRLLSALPGSILPSGEPGLPTISRPLIRRRTSLFEKASPSAQPFGYGAATLTAVLSLMAASPLQAQTGYQKPPKEILDVLKASPTPQVSLSPQGMQLLLLEGGGAPTIADLAQPMLRLAGLRINPATNG